MRWLANNLVPRGNFGDRVGPKINQKIFVPGQNSSFYSSGLMIIGIVPLSAELWFTKQCRWKYDS